MPAQALHEVVKVDLNITGCPIEKEEFVAAIASLLNGDAPLAVEYPVCTECRMRENNCLLTERGEICCGPLTVAGCGARCPELRIGCVGCRGPVEDANSASLVAEFEARGFARQDIAARLRTFAGGGGAPAARWRPRFRPAWWRSSKHAAPPARISPPACEPSHPKESRH